MENQKEQVEEPNKEGIGTLIAIACVIGLALLLVQLSIIITPYLNHLIWGMDIVK